MPNPDRGIRLLATDPAPVALGTIWVNTTSGLAKLAEANDGTSPLNGVLNTTWFALTSDKSLTNPLTSPRDFGASITAFPANSLIASRVLRVTFGGSFNVGTLASTITLQMYFGGPGGTTISQPLNFNGGTAVPGGTGGGWLAQLYYTQQTAGASGAWATAGFMVNVSGVTITHENVAITDTGTLNTTLQQQMGIGAYFGTDNSMSAANNTITLRTCIGEIII
jgi:hypothetical protein